MSLSHAGLPITGPRITGGAPAKSPDIMTRAACIPSLQLSPDTTPSGATWPFLGAWHDSPYFAVENFLTTGLTCGPPASAPRAARFCNAIAPPNSRGALLRPDALASAPSGGDLRPRAAGAR